MLQLQRNVAKRTLRGGFKGWLWLRFCKRSTARHVRNVRMRVVYAWEAHWQRQCSADKVRAPPVVLCIRSCCHRSSNIFEHVIGQP